MSATLGLVTIGQTPRPDFEHEFRRHRPETDIRIVGALDGLSAEEIDRLAATSSEYPLHTRLTDGSTAEIPITALTPLVSRRVEQLAEAGPDLIVVLCTGDFPDFNCSVPVLLPGRLVPDVARLISRNRRIGVVTPLRGQVEAAQKKWKDDGFSAQVTAAAPSHPDEIEQAALALSDKDLDLVVLDCMGHDESYRKAFALRCPWPVLLAQTLVARVAAEILDGCID